MIDHEFIHIFRIISFSSSNIELDVILLLLEF